MVDRSRSRSTSSPRSLCVELSEEEPVRRVPVELISMDSEHMVRFLVDRDATIGQVSARFKASAFEKFGSDSFFESYRTGFVVLMNPGTSSVRFKLSDAYARIMNTKVIREFCREHPDDRLLFQLVRCAR